VSQVGGIKEAVLSSPLWRENRACPTLFRASTRCTVESYDPETIKLPSSFTALTISYDRRSEHDLVCRVERTWRTL